MMNRISTAAAALLMLGVTGFAQAATKQKTTPPANHNPAREIIAARLATDLNPKQIGVLNLVAHAAASALTCPRINMNEEAVKGAVAAVINENPPTAADEMAMKAYHDRIVVGFGALVGLMVDEAGNNQASFCTLAEKEMTEDGNRSFLTLAAAK